MQRQGELRKNGRGTKLTKRERKRLAEEEAEAKMTPEQKEQRKKDREKAKQRQEWARMAVAHPANAYRHGRANTGIPDFRKIFGGKGKIFSVFGGGGNNAGGGIFGGGGNNAGGGGIFGGGGNNAGGGIFGGGGNNAGGGIFGGGGNNAGVPIFGGGGNNVGGGNNAGGGMFGGGGNNVGGGMFGGGGNNAGGGIFAGGGNNAGGNNAGSIFDGIMNGILFGNPPGGVAPPPARVHHVVPKHQYRNMFIRDTTATKPVDGFPDFFVNGIWFQLVPVQASSYGEGTPVFQLPEDAKAAPALCNDPDAECPVCCDLYSNRGGPVVVHCEKAHTFCRGCVVEQIKQSIAKDSNFAACMCPAHHECKLQKLSQYFIQAVLEAAKQQDLLKEFQSFEEQKKMLLRGDVVGGGGPRPPGGLLQLGRVVAPLQLQVAWRGGRQM